MTRPRRAVLTCPVCGGWLDKVVDTRPTEAGIRRRRTCMGGHQVITIEVIESARAA